MLKQLLNAKTSVVGTALIATGSSLLTVLALHGADLAGQSMSPMAAMPAMTTESVLECGADVYSPVQRKCVSQQVFDEEMKRLFAALGIDASIYSPDAETN